MSNEAEIKELVNKLKSKAQLKAYEKRFLDIYNKKTCDEELIKQLQLEGLNKYIERDYKADFKTANRAFVSDIKEQGKSLKGNWGDAPPPPPAIPDDCCIM
jgi:hypothetical protein